MSETDTRKALEGLSAEQFLELLEKATPDQLEAIAQVGQKARVNTALVPRVFANTLAAPGTHSDVLSIIVWWEKRRPTYNLVVGLAGLPVLMLLALAFHAPISVLFNGTLAYAIAANICYTLGEPAEILAWLLWKNKATHIGPVLLSLGGIFSVCLTLGIGFCMALAATAMCLLH